MDDEPGEAKEVTILNRTLRWTGKNLEYEADGKHVEVLRKELGLDPLHASNNEPD